MQFTARLNELRRKLSTTATYDRDQTESQQNATVDSCFELLGSRQHGVAQQNSRTIKARLHALHVVVNYSPEHVFPSPLSEYPALHLHM